MKVSALRRQLNELASAIRIYHADAEANALSELADLLTPFGRRNVAELKLPKSFVSSSSANSGGANLSTLVKTLRTFDGFISRAASASTRGGFYHLQTLMNDRQDMTIRSFIDALHSAFSPERPNPANDTSLVDAYVDALRAAKHDDKKFPALFETLSSDERLTKDDVVEVASKFAFKMAKSTTKKAALAGIWKMHSASETFAAKSKASKGKSAA